MRNKKVSGSNPGNKDCNKLVRCSIGAICDSVTPGAPASVDRLGKLGGGTGGTIIPNFNSAVPAAPPAAAALPMVAPAHVKAKAAAAVVADPMVAPCSHPLRWTAFRLTLRNAARPAVRSAPH